MNILANACKRMCCLGLFFVVVFVLLCGLCVFVLGCVCWCVRVLRVACCLFWGCVLLGGVALFVCIVVAGYMCVVWLSALFACVCCCVVCLFVCLLILFVVCACSLLLNLFVVMW